MLRPGAPAPQAGFATLGHGVLNPVEMAPPGGWLLTLFADSADPASRAHLKALDDMIGDFAVRGVLLLAATGDSPENAAAMVREMQLIRLPVAAGLDSARLASDWGLERDAPGHFWIRPDATIGLSAVCDSARQLPDAGSLLQEIIAKQR